jgi:hypothetical protein
MRPLIFCCQVLCLLVLGSGCTHVQLRRSTLDQASTITSLQYQQVLSNMAAFHCHPEVLPHLAVVGTGGALVSDEGATNVELEWDPSRLVKSLLGLEGRRKIQEQWTLAPVINPDKLRAIRCAYQLVVQGHATDPECDKLLTAFLGAGYGEWLTQGWYCVGARKDVPSNAIYVAHSEDCYVWVMPEGIEGLSRLTLVMLNIATIDPNPAPEEPTKTVEQHFYSDGKLDRIETFTRPDPEAPKASPRAIRKDFYNPIQSQIQMRGGD